MSKQIALFDDDLELSEEKEFIVKHDDRKYQPSSWNASYRHRFGDRNQGRIVKASDEKEAIKIMSDKFNLNSFYLVAEPATDKNKKGAKGIDEELAMNIFEKRAALGSGKRFKALTKKLKAKGAYDPKALAAWIGRKKYGKEKMAALSLKGRKAAKKEDIGVFTDDFRDYLISLAEGPENEK